MRILRASFFAATLGLAGLAAALPATAKLNSCDEPIVLGTTISETGLFSTLADKWRRMTEAFVEEVNKGGGVMVKSCNKKVPIKIVLYDDQSVPATAVALYEKMATVDNVDFFVGPDWSSMGGPVPPVAEKHKIPMVAANVATPALFDRGLKYFWATPFPVVPRWSERYFDMISKVSPKPQSIFFVVHDNPVMKGIAGVWSKKAEGQGIKIVGNETFSQELKDFTALISKIRAARPDIVYIASFDNPSVPLVQQMRQLKVRAMDVHHVMLTGALSRQVNKDIEGMTGELAWYPGVKGPYSDVVEKVMASSGVTMFDYIWTLGRLSSYLVMMQAIEKAGVIDREKVKEALFKGTFKSPAGDIVFDDRGFPDNGAFAVQMQGGKVQVVWPPNVATGKLQWPSPTWQ
jgi:ABC-type branched-subunit amino acid transport system substrate-binding protein